MTSVGVVVFAGRDGGPVVACLEAAGYDVRVGLSVDLEAHCLGVDAVVVEYGHVDVPSTLASLRAVVPGMPLIVVSGPVGEDVAVGHVKLGVADWVVEDRLDRLPAAVAEAIRSSRQDVTALRSREAQLRDAEERFRLSFDEAPIGVALVALDGRWLRVNRALCAIVGYSGEQMLRLGFQDITHPDDVGADMEHIRKLVAGEIQTNEIEKRYLHADGHVVWIQLNVSLARDEWGVPLYFITQIQDISGRKATEEKVRSSEERFRGLMESAPDAMVIVGSDGRIVLVNRQTEQLFGFDRGELVGQPVETLIPEQFRARHAAHRSGYIGDPKVRPWAPASNSSAYAATAPSSPSRSA